MKAKTWKFYLMQGPHCCNGPEFVLKVSKFNIFLASEGWSLSQEIWIGEQCQFPAPGAESGSGS